MQTTRRRGLWWKTRLWILALAGISQACSPPPPIESANPATSLATAQPSMTASPVSTQTATALPATTTSTPSETPTPTATPTQTVTPTYTTTPTPKPVIHVVERGDVLGRIAQRYGVTVEQIAEANGIDPDDVLSLGRELIIPVLATSDQAEPPTPTISATPTTTATVTPSATTTVTAVSVTATRTEPAARTTATTVPTMLVDIIHTVEQGEYLGLIARRYEIDEDLIAKANGITSSTILRIGQRLLIPSVPVTLTPTARPTQASLTGEQTPEPAEPRADVVHVVERGDTLSAIAVRYDVSITDIAEANGISTNAVLSIGQELVIPSIPVTPTITPTATPTWTLTPTPTLTPTLARSSETYRFRAPYLLGPLQDAAYQGTQARILLNWTSVGILGPNQWYLVQIWPTGRTSDMLEIWTKATSHRPEQSLLPESWGNTTRLSWRVTVVERLPGDPPWRALSPTSHTRRFSWDRQALSP